MSEQYIFDSRQQSRQRQLNLITNRRMGAKLEKNYEQSHHLISKQIVVQGNVYSYQISAIINDISKFQQEVMNDNKLAKYLAKKFDIWFLQDDREKKLNIAAQFDLFQQLNKDKTKKKPVQFMELKNKQALRQFMVKTEEIFNMSEKMNRIVDEFPTDVEGMKRFYQGNSIRKEQDNPRLTLNSEEESMGVLEALVGNYYLKVLQKEGHADDVKLIEYLDHFHQKCGVPLMKFILKGILSSSQLIIILFQLLTIFSKSSKLQKADIPKLIKEHLQRINEEFKFRLIEEQFTYTVPKETLRNLKYIANCYNADLYRSSLNQIQNPKIEEEPDSYIKNVNTFPVHTVKESYKKV